MSRNLRYKSPQTPVKKKVSRRSSRATDNSSDDDYAGVDLISDDEESEPDVEGLEEQAIIDSEADDDEEDDLQSTPRAQFDDDTLNWQGYELSSAPPPGETFFDEHMARMDAPDHGTETAPGNATTSSISEETGTPGRRVHFDLSDSDDGGDTDPDDDFFPDIFLDQNHLDPGFRRTIENDEDEDRADSDDDWEFNGSDSERTPQQKTQTRNHEDSDDDESTGSSGYEST